MAEKKFPKGSSSSSLSEVSPAPLTLQQARDLAHNLGAGLHKSTSHLGAYERAAVDGAFGVVLEGLPLSAAKVFRRPAKALPESDGSAKKKSKKA